MEVFKCATCDERYESSEDLQEHLWKIHIEQQDRCETSTTTTTQERAIQVPISAPADKKPTKTKSLVGRTDVSYQDSGAYPGPSNGHVQSGSIQELQGSSIGSGQPSNCVSGTHGTQGGRPQRPSNGPEKNRQDPEGRRDSEESEDKSFEEEARKLFEEDKEWKQIVLNYIKDNGEVSAFEILDIFPFDIVQETFRFFSFHHIIDQLEMGNGPYKNLIKCLLNVGNMEIEEFFSIILPFFRKKPPLKTGIHLIHQNFAKLLLYGGYAWNLKIDIDVLLEGVDECHITQFLKEMQRWDIPMSKRSRKRAATVKIEVSEMNPIIHGHQKKSSQNGAPWEGVSGSRVPEIKAGNEIHGPNGDTRKRGHGEQGPQNGEWSKESKIFKTLKAIGDQGSQESQHQSQESMNTLAGNSAKPGLQNPPAQNGDIMGESEGIQESEETQQEENHWYLESTDISEDSYEDSEGQDQQDHDELMPNESGENQGSQENPNSEIDLYSYLNEQEEQEKMRKAALEWEELVRKRSEPIPLYSIRNSLLSPAEILRAREKFSLWELMGKDNENIIDKMLGVIAKSRSDLERIVYGCFEEVPIPSGDTQIRLLQNVAWLPEYSLEGESWSFQSCRINHDTLLQGVDESDWIKTRMGLIGREAEGESSETAQPPEPTGHDMEVPTGSEGEAAPEGEILGDQEGSREAQNGIGHGQSQGQEHENLEIEQEDNGRNQHKDGDLLRPELVSLFDIRLAGLPDDEMQAAKYAFSSLAHYENHKALLTRMFSRATYDTPLSFKEDYCWKFFKEEPPSPQKLKQNVVKMTIWNRNARNWQFNYDEESLLEGISDQFISFYRASWLAPNLDLSSLSEEEMAEWKEAVAHVVQDPGIDQGEAVDEEQAEAAERVQEQEPVLSSQPNHDSNLPEQEASPESEDFGNGQNQEHENARFRQPGPSYSNHLDSMEEYDFDYDGFPESGLPQTSEVRHEQEQGAYEYQNGDGRSPRSQGSYEAQNDYDHMALPTGNTQQEDLDEENKEADQSVRNNETRRKLMDTSLYSLRYDMSELSKLNPVELLDKETRLKGTKLVKVLRKMALDLYQNPVKTPPLHPTGGYIMQENLSKMFCFYKEKPRWHFFFILGDLLEGLSRQERIDVLGLMEQEKSLSSDDNQAWYYDFKTEDSSNSIQNASLEEEAPAETAPGENVNLASSRRDSFDYEDNPVEVDFYGQEEGEAPKPAKRGRGRPPGSRNRNRTVTERPNTRRHPKEPKTQNPEEDSLQSSIQSLKLLQARLKKEKQRAQLQKQQQPRLAQLKSAGANRDDRNCDGTAPGPSNRNNRKQLDISDSSEDSEDDYPKSSGSPSSSDTSDDEDDSPDDKNFPHSSTGPSAPQDEMDSTHNVEDSSNDSPNSQITPEGSSSSLSRSPVVSVKIPKVPSQVSVKKGRGRPRKDPNKIVPKRSERVTRRNPQESKIQNPEESTSQESPQPSSSHGANVDETRTEELDPIEDIGNYTEVQSPPESFAEPLSPIQALDHMDDHEDTLQSQHLLRFSMGASTDLAAPLEQVVEPEDHPEDRNSRQGPSSDSQAVEDHNYDFEESPEVPPAAQQFQDHLSVPSTPHHAPEDQVENPEDHPAAQSSPEPSPESSSDVQASEEYMADTEDSSKDNAGAQYSKECLPGPSSSPQDHVDVEKPGSLPGSQNPSGRSSQQASPRLLQEQDDPQAVEDDIGNIEDAPEDHPNAENIQNRFPRPSTPRQAREDQAEQPYTVTLYDIANSELSQEDIKEAKQLFKAIFMKFIDRVDFYTTAKTFWTRKQSLDEGARDCGDFLLTFFETTRRPGTGNEGIMMDNYARVFTYHLETKWHWWTYKNPDLILTGLDRADPEVDAIIVEHKRNMEFVKLLQEQEQARLEKEKRLAQLERDDVNQEDGNRDGTAPGPSNRIERRDVEIDDSVEESEEDPSFSGSSATLEDESENSPGGKSFPHSSTGPSAPQDDMDYIDDMEDSSGDSSDARGHPEYESPQDLIPGPSTSRQAPVDEVEDLEGHPEAQNPLEPSPEPSYDIQAAEEYLDDFDDTPEDHPEAEQSQEFLPGPSTPPQVDQVEQPESSLDAQRPSGPSPGSPIPAQNPVAEPEDNTIPESEELLTNWPSSQPVNEFWRLTRDLESGPREQRAERRTEIIRELSKEYSIRKKAAKWMQGIFSASCVLLTGKNYGAYSEGVKPRITLGILKPIFDTLMDAAILLSQARKSKKDLQTLNEHNGFHHVLEVLQLLLSQICTLFTELVPGGEENQLCHFFHSISESFDVTLSNYERADEETRTSYLTEKKIIDLRQDETAVGTRCVNDALPLVHLKRDPVCLRRVKTILDWYKCLTTQHPQKVAKIRSSSLRILSQGPNVNADQGAVPPTSTPPTRIDPSRNGFFGRADSDSASTSRPSTSRSVQKRPRGFDNGDQSVPKTKQRRR